MNSTHWPSRLLAGLQAFAAQLAADELGRRNGDVRAQPAKDGALSYRNRTMILFFGEVEAIRSGHWDWDDLAWSEH